MKNTKTICGPNLRFGRISFGYVVKSIQSILVDLVKSIFYIEMDIGVLTLKMTNLVCFGIFPNTKIHSLQFVVLYILVCYYFGML